MIHCRMTIVSYGAMGTLNPGISLGKIHEFFRTDTSASLLTGYLELIHQEVMIAVASRICPSPA